ncbi:UNVERIFIED_CONTAM: hypothetical protein Sradi_7269900 [Sesamum radiatum]|uniref:Uncharacterized protein n=1 Tax=Sesamum radiatum TaxID=300843 RepID=A0AAW2IJQ2_SESRA
MKLGCFSGPQSKYICALPSTSDHSPLILAGYDANGITGSFRFDNFLAKQSGFLNSVWSIWRHPIHGTRMYAVVTKLKALKPVFRRQRKQKGDLASNVQSAKLFLEKAQSLFDTHKEDILLQLVKLCQRIYCQAVQQELSMLKQRSKLNWLKDGDQCTRLFFRKINARRVRQRIYQINDESGVQLTDLSQIVAEFLSYFQQLLGGNRMQRNLDLSFLQPGLKHILSMDEANLLLTPVTQQEIKEAFFDINDDSAPGPDGYSSAFLKMLGL